jgi:excisionase family DNA binding protein
MKKQKDEKKVTPEFSKRHLSIQTFAAITDSKEPTIRSWIFRGMIPVVRLGRSVRIPIDIAENIISSGLPGKVK